MSSALKNSVKHFSKLKDNPILLIGLLVLIILSLGGIAVLNLGGLTGAVTGLDTEGDLGIQAAATSTSCGDVASDLTLTADVENESTCFTITANDVTLDCDGFTINYSIFGGANERGVYATSKSNVTIKNCNIVDGNWSAAESTNLYRDGIYYLTVTDSFILNTNVSVYGNASNGIYLYTSSNNNLTSNTGTSNSSYGIHIRTASDNNILISNTGTSTSGVGFHLNAASNNILTSNTGTSNSSYGFYLSSSSNNGFIFLLLPTTT
jgi:parallel beta-helix repeat protein